MRTVFTNGCFDILHAGHVHLFKEARKLGEYLIVGINSDAAVRALKGNGRPLQPFEQRAYAVRELRCVGTVMEVNSTDMCEILGYLVPNVWVKGGDYTEASLNQREVAVAKKLGIRIVLLPIMFNVHTSKLL